MIRNARSVLSVTLKETDLKPEFMPALYVSGLYLVLWISCLGLFSAAEGAFLATTKLPPWAQREWLAGLAHARMLVGVYASFGSGGAIVLAALSVNVHYSWVVGLVFALFLHLLSRWLRRRGY